MARPLALVKPEAQSKPDLLSLVLQTVSIAVRMDKRARRQGLVLMNLAKAQAEDRKTLRSIEGKLDALMADLATPPPIDERAEALAATLPAVSPARVIGDEHA